MKKITTIIFTLSILLIVGLACEFSTANLVDITFSDDDKGTKTFTSAKHSDKIYVLSGIKNASGKHLIRWKVTDSTGEEVKLPENDIMIEGARPIWLTILLKSEVFPEGKYTFNVKLLTENGDKEFDAKTGTLEVKE